MKIFGLTIIAMLAGCATLPGSTVSLSAFNQVATGMSHFEVATLLGGPGEMLSTSTFGAVTDTIYDWKNSDGSNATVTFQNENEISKAQYGLR